MHTIPPNCLEYRNTVCESDPSSVSCKPFWNASGIDDDVVTELSLIAINCSTAPYFTSNSINNLMLLHPINWNVDTVATYFTIFGGLYLKMDAGSGHDVPANMHAAGVTG